MRESSYTSRPLALITGASSGIGFELAKQFAQNGFDIVIAAEDNGIASAADSLEQAGAETVVPVQVDLRDPGAVEELYEQAISLGRPIDAVALNAGVGVGGAFEDTSLEAELGMIELNVSSVVHLAKLAIPDMVERGRGCLLFTSSIASQMPAPFLAVYGASKAFVQSFAEAIRNELKDTGVTVTSLLPGPTDTQFFERAHMETTKAGASEKDDPAKVAKQGFDALMKGDDHVVAGSFKNKVQAVIAKLLPDTAKAQMHRGQIEPNKVKDPQDRGAA